MWWVRERGNRVKKRERGGEGKTREDPQSYNVILLYILSPDMCSSTVEMHGTILEGNPLIIDQCNHSNLPLMHTVETSQ